MSTPRVVGLDLSIAATGYANGGHGYPDTRTIRTDPKNYGPTPRDTWRRLATIAIHITNHIGAGPPPALVVVEGPSYGSKGAGTWDRGGLWWLIYDILTRSGHPIAVIPPAVLKKYATGRGNADKTAMAVALHRRAGIELGDDNQVDAWWLAAAGLDILGHPIVSVPAAHSAALDKIRPEANR